ncbi:asparagine synthase (glutamine-hydrolyzing) [Thermicanus aegyptius]|uniref:asparagine synthase (glutamine-hydrolyzing) n=1 Tax=Thermicanus aegyptius TaxID=94009 RepID=UPI00040CE963|nr:asparagine synthase (glutamine-hydrolyzing) [Thermicanus aegyptius]
MCGISGWIDWVNDPGGQTDTLEEMNERISPRGPDDAGFWAKGPAAFTHRRLVVVDPAGGKQPMIRAKEGRLYVLVYNGELYNTEELRRELREKGYSFEGHSDTEVLLLSYIEWGPACVERLNGIYAFAIWDEGREQLFMARDRIGVKPLFYYETPHGLIFASEIKALLANPLVPSRIDGEGLAEIFALGPGRTPGVGVFRGIKEVLPGDSILFDRNGLRIIPYWRLESKPHEDDLEKTIATVRELVLDAVERQLVSDVPVCSFLSGGLDSSAISAVASRYYQERRGEVLHTFSVDYVENDRYFRKNEFQPNPDAPWVEKMVRYLGTHHHPVLIDTPELYESLFPALIARDLPGMTDVDSSLLLFSAEIKKWATVALSGECADEIFAGYPWFFREDLITAPTFPWSVKLKDRIRYLSPELVEAIRPEEYVAHRYEEALSEVPRLPGESEQEARMREIQYLSLTRWMPVLLDRKDRMSMAVGLEVRVPFADHRIVEYLWNVPWEWKALHGREKGLLRAALTGILPAEVLERKKSPYPKTHNPSYLAAVKQGMYRLLDDPHSPILPLIHRKEVMKLLEEATPESHLPWFGQLMNVPQLFAYLIQVNAWLKEYRVEITL